jgi:hypothetical protein
MILHKPMQIVPVEIRTSVFEDHPYMRTELLGQADGILLPQV